MASLKYNWGLVAVFILLSTSMIRNETFHGGPWLGQTGRDLNRLDREIYESMRLANLVIPMTREVEYLFSDLRNRTGTLVASPDDGLTWGAGQITLSALQLGLQVDEITEVTTRRIPSRRDEPARIFTPIRLRTELRGDLPEALLLIQQLQERNPYVVVAGLEVGIERPDDGLRRISLVLDWPRWNDGAFLDLVLADATDPTDDEGL
jgi:hypothetical protein